jgi:dTDP-4-dehydrorhamnose 3,5-epimerase
MISGVIINKLNKFVDDRGYLAELYRADETKYLPKMAYYSVTEPGIVRGPHEHLRQSDFFAFVGPGEFELYLWDNRPDSATYGQAEKMVVGESNPLSVIIPPNIVHGYKCISAVPAISINMPDTLYKGEGKQEEVDEIRYENDPNSKFII